MSETTKTKGIIYLQVKQSSSIEKAVSRNHKPQEMNSGTGNWSVYLLSYLVPTWNLNADTLNHSQTFLIPFCFTKQVRRTYSLNLREQHLEDAWNNALVTVGCLSLNHRTLRTPHRVSFATSSLNITHQKLVLHSKHTITWINGYSLD